MSNIIDAIINIVNNPMFELKKYDTTNNRANDMGKALEEYVKDVFANTLYEKNQTKRNNKISNTFSYLGNKNNPPDCILRGGDAIEVKKIQEYKADLALNSSHPKSMLYANSPLISKACINCESWTEKEIIYITGVVNEDNLSDLAMVYGMDYAASEDAYLRVKEYIKDSISHIPDVDFSETKELGRVNNVDPLGITYLRIRGMWGISNPFNVFQYIYTKNKNHRFNLMVIISLEKFKSFENSIELLSLSLTVPNLKIRTKQIYDPNNKANLVDAMLITFSKE